MSLVDGGGTGAKWADIRHGSVHSNVILYPAGDDMPD